MLNCNMLDSKNLKDNKKEDWGDDETNYLIKVIRYMVSKLGFLYPVRDNPLPANWGVPRLMREERRAKRSETKRRGLTKNLERRLRESRVEIIRFVRFLSLCNALFWEFFANGKVISPKIYSVYLVRLYNYDALKMRE